jgi:hypothetical protein
VLTRNIAQERLGESLVVWIDPRKVEGYVDATDTPLHRRVRTLKRLQLTTFARALGARHPFSIDRQSFPPVRAFTELERFRRVLDVVSHLDDYRASDWYLELSDAVDRVGYASYKHTIMRSASDVDAFFRGTVVDLATSLRRHGYLVERSDSHGLAVVGSDGRLRKANHGRHRFFMAHLLGIAPMPLRIVAAHREWAAPYRLDATPAGIDRLRAAVEEVARLHS